MTDSRIRNISLPTALIFIATTLIASLITSVIPANSATTRSLIDRPDEQTGPQVHLIYAISSDGQDKKWDTNGQIQSWVDQAQYWLNNQVGRQLRFDTFQGQVDVTFFRSKLTNAEIKSRARVEGSKEEDSLDSLINDYIKQSPLLDYKKNPKTYVIMYGDRLGADYCGYAFLPSIRAIGTFGGECWYGGEYTNQPISEFSGPSYVMIHELFHTYGVEHTCDNQSDLMWGAGCPAITGRVGGATLDQDRKDYFGGEKSGVDISKLPIWLDGKFDAAYVKEVAIETFAFKSGNKYIAPINEKSQWVAWSWKRTRPDPDAGTFECSITNGKSTFSGTTEEGRCNYIVPLTWRGGTTMTVSAKFWVGPFTGEATTELNIWNPENQFEACTSKYCFVGEELPIKSRYCYSNNPKQFTLQIFQDGKWQDLNTTPARPAIGCNDAYFQATPVNYKFDRAGIFTYRWLKGNKNSQDYDEVETITILESDAPYPIGTSREELDKRAALANLQATKAAEQLKECSKGKNCYVGEQVQMPSLCFSTNVGNFRLEILRDKKWEILGEATVELGNSNCGDTLYGVPNLPQTFNEVGIQVVRWRATTPGINFLSNAYAILIGAKDSGAPTNAELSQAAQLARDLAREADDLIAREAAAAKLKADQEAQAKAAAEKAAAQKKSLICVKGKSKITVTGKKSSCPKGYKPKS